MSFKQRPASDFGLREEVLTFLRELARKHGLTRLILFGSRARGNYRDRSDIDLAAEGGDPEAFHLDAEEEAPTLLFFDVVNLNRFVSGGLQQEISRDGVLLYEKV